MPTTREVEAGRVERRRRETEAAAARPAKPRTATERRAARAAEAHRVATARNQWRCRVDGCPMAGVWQAPEVDTKAAAFAEADAHYDREHYRPQERTR